MRKQMCIESTGLIILAIVIKSFSRDLIGIRGFLEVNVLCNEPFDPNNVYHL